MRRDDIDPVDREIPHLRREWLEAQEEFPPMNWRTGLCALIAIVGAIIVSAVLDGWFAGVFK